MKIKESFNLFSGSNLMLDNNRSLADIFDAVETGDDSNSVK